MGPFRYFSRLALTATLRQRHTTRREQSIRNSYRVAQGVEIISIFHFPSFIANVRMRKRRRRIKLMMIAKTIRLLFRFIITIIIDMLFCTCLKSQISHLNSPFSILHSLFPFPVPFPFPFPFPISVGTRCTNPDSHSNSREGLCRKAGKMMRLCIHGARAGKT